MPEVTFKIDKYLIGYSTKGSWIDLIIVQVNPLPPPPQNIFNAKLIFLPNDAILPPLVTNPSYILYYHKDDYYNIIDILRNEKPLKLWVQSTPLGPTGGIRTSGVEPVGEGE